MRLLFQALQCWPRDIQHHEMGRIEEIRLDWTYGNVVRKGGPFQTSDFLQEFRSSSVAYVGISVLTDEEINQYGISALVAFA